MLIEINISWGKLKKASTYLWHKYVSLDKYLFGHPKKCPNTCSRVTKIKNAPRKVKGFGLDFQINIFEEENTTVILV